MPSLFATILNEAADLGIAAARVAGRSAAGAPTKTSKRKVGNSCTPCAAKKTAAKVWKQLDKKMWRK